MLDVILDIFHYHNNSKLCFAKFSRSNTTQPAQQHMEPLEFSLSTSEDIFKYQRLKGKLGSTIKTDNITASCLEENVIVLGTSRGHIYVFGINCKLVKSYQGHSGAVRDIAIDQHNQSIYRFCMLLHMTNRIQITLLH